jgi:hypothetical protein
MRTYPVWANGGLVTISSPYTHFGSGESKISPDCSPDTCCRRRVASRRSSAAMANTVGTIYDAPAQRADGTSPHRASAAPSVGSIRLLSRHQQQIQLLMSTAPAELLPRAGPEQHAAWTAARARHRPWALQPGRGGAPGSKEALRLYRSLTMVCPVPDCAALVDRSRARAQARAAGRDVYVPGDGCAGRRCASRGQFKPRRFAVRQQAMAAQLANGERRLIRWPDGPDDRCVHAYPQAVARCVADLTHAELVRRPPLPPDSSRSVA